jgi:hypothetical protein
METRNIERCISNSKESDSCVDAARWELVALIERITEFEAALTSATLPPAVRLCENCHEPVAAHVGTSKICPNGEWNNWGRDARKGEG